MLASRNARHKHHGISNPNSARHVPPEHHNVQSNRDMVGRAHVLDRECETSVKHEPSDSDSIFPVSLHSNNIIGHMGTSHNNSPEQRLTTGESLEAFPGYLSSHGNRLSPTMQHSRKRSFSNAEERCGALPHSDTKSKRLSPTSRSNSPAGQDSTQSLLSVIGVTNAREERQLRGHNSDPRDPNQTGNV